MRTLHTNNPTGYVEKTKTVKGKKYKRTEKLVKDSLLSPLSPQPLSYLHPSNSLLPVEERAKPDIKCQHRFERGEEFRVTHSRFRAQEISMAHVHPSTRQDVVITNDHGLGDPRAGGDGLRYERTRRAQHATPSKMHDSSCDSKRPLCIWNISNVFISLSTITQQQYPGTRPEPLSIKLLVGHTKRLSLKPGTIFLITLVQASHGVKRRS